MNKWWKVQRIVTDWEILITWAQSGEPHWTPRWSRDLSLSVWTAASRLWPRPYSWYHSLEGSESETKRRIDISYWYLTGAWSFTVEQQHYGFHIFKPFLLIFTACLKILSEIGGRRFPAKFSTHITVHEVTCRFASLNDGDTFWEMGR